PLDLLELAPALVGHAIAELAVHIRAPAVGLSVIGDAAGVVRAGDDRGEALVGRLDRGDPALVVAFDVATELAVRVGPPAMRLPIVIQRAGVHLAEAEGGGHELLGPEAQDGEVPALFGI